MWVGTFIMTLGFGLYIDLGVDTSIGAIVAFQLVAGFGCGFLFSSPLVALQANVSQDDTATASAAMGTIRNLGSTMSIVLGGVVFQNGMQLRIKDLSQAGLPPHLIRGFGDDAAANIGEIARIQDPSQQRVAREAFAWSVRNMFIMYTCVAFFACISTAFIGKHILSHEHTETKTGLKRKEEQQPQTHLLEDRDPLPDGDNDGLHSV